MVDLHTHTTYSDGKYTVKELLKEAEKNKVEILSITDHDCIKAHQELRNSDYNNIFSGRIIKGSEFNAVFDGAKIELLGYNFDIDIMDKYINETYDDNKVSLKKEYFEAIESCRKNNIKVDVIKYESSMGWPIDLIHKSMKKYKENRGFFTKKQWEDSDYFFRCCSCIKDFPVHLDFSYNTPSAKKVSDMIRKSNGKVFLAHLFTYPLQDYTLFLDRIRKENVIDGIEVYYSKFTDKQIKFLEEYCKKYNLFMSAGSDCHGKKSQVGIGLGNMNVSGNVIENWINK